MQIMGKTVAKTWNFESDSSQGKFYESVLYVDGSTSCGCKGWTQRKPDPDGNRTCKHTRMIDSGVADQAAAASQTYATLSAATIVNKKFPAIKAAKAGKGKAAKQEPETKGRKFDFSDDPPDNNARKISW